MGIAPDSEKDDKKIHFAFIKYLSLQMIVKDLRKFGQPLKTIAAVKNYLFDEDIDKNRTWPALSHLVKLSA